MGGVAGQWFKPFALTIACAVLVSLFVSFSLDPMLSAYWPDPHLPLERAAAASRALLDRFNHWFDRQAERYKRVIALGARPPLRDGRARGRRRSSARWRCRRWGRRRRASCPRRTTPSSASTLETPPGSSLAYTRAEGAGGRAHRAHASGGASTPTRRSAAHERRRWTGTRLRAADAEARAARAARQQVVGGHPRASSARSAASTAVDQQRLHPGAEADPAAAQRAGRRRS